MEQARELIKELRIKDKKKEEKKQNLFIQPFFIFPRDVGYINYS